MLTPGAYRSTQDPKLENDACLSAESLAATVTAPGTRAGEAVQASTAEFPAATTVVTPSSMTAWMAASTVLLAAPPRLRLATAGIPAAWFAAIQSRPATTSEL